MHGFRSKKGFTLLEVIIVMAILVILALAASTRFRFTSHQLDAVAKVLRSNIQLAQDFAMTHSSAYGFRSINATSYEIYEGTPGTPARNPLTRGDLVVSISPVAFQGVVPSIEFDSSGKPNIVSDATITLVENSITRQLTVKTDTGVVNIGP